MYPHLLVDLGSVRQREPRAEVCQFGHARRARARESHWPKRRSVIAARPAVLSAGIAVSLIGAALMAVANRAMVDDASSNTADSSVGAVYDVPVPEPTAVVVIDSTSFMFRTA